MLKEQDPMIELLREWIMSPVGDQQELRVSVLEVFSYMSELMAEHAENPERSRLKKFLPHLKKIFLPLDLTRAALEYDASTHFLARKRVPPTFKEVRHILNLATTNAIAGKLKLVTFDADDTIYEDGGTISKSSRMVQVIVELLRRGVVVSLVTAAGYPGNPGRYEERLRGILEALEDVTMEERARFLVMGGECNYLFETHTDKTTGVVGLREIDGAVWKDGRGERWPENQVTALLDAAEVVLKRTVKELHLSARILRKERAIGIINTSKKRILYENLEEISLTLQHELRHFRVPFCAFNGGNDVWVDIGHKALGIQALQKYVFRFLPEELRDSEELRNIQGQECLHVGDRFTRTGNDTRSRDAATTIWISNPQETVHIMTILLRTIDLVREQKRERREEREKEKKEKKAKALTTATATTTPSDDGSDVTSDSNVSSDGESSGSSDERETTVKAAIQAATTASLAE
ncbi:IMP-specific 5'-nucleotidase 1 [Phytophthora nicotianae]|uniref:IMP-specific 5'-nucleotidase 1 n=1 Tax=Phytophthora nicotianae TaxID=4792 RepID=A0A0W8DAY0_PHYNI|nr:Endoglucanase A [Phytophthora nicotianae]KUG01595.1 IMP-specific 5'-nucleotidase 1 [Phytophthora nicotianae]